MCHELATWRPLGEHFDAKVSVVRPALVELDSYYLPDRAGTAYQLAHVKSTVAIVEIDIAAKHLGYFHNQGYYRLSGQDFEDIFQTQGLVHPRMLPPYIEFVKQAPNFKPLTRGQLVETSTAILKEHLALMPKTNPFARFKESFARDMEWLLQSDIEAFHAYSFATLRQYGACYELASTYLQWLSAESGRDHSTAQEAFAQITQSTKALQFQLARAMARKRALDLVSLDEMAALWDTGTQCLLAQYGS